jgi:hypothetical protein
MRPVQVTHKAPGSKRDELRVYTMANRVLKNGAFFPHCLSSILLANIIICLHCRTRNGQSLLTFVCSFLFPLLNTHMNANFILAWLD